MGDSQKPVFKQLGTWVWVALFVLLVLALGVLIVPRLGPAIPAPQPSTYGEPKVVVR